MPSPSYASKEDVPAQYRWDPQSIFSGPEAWQAAFAEHGLDPLWYAHRVRLADEIFPWDHINAGVEKRWLLLDWL